MNIQTKKNLNQTLKTQQSSSICYSNKSNLNEVAYKIIKNPNIRGKIINLDLKKKFTLKINTNNNTNTNINTTNNIEDSMKNKEKDKNKMNNDFNSILNITNNKSRNLQPKNNTLENKTAENVNIKIFATNQPKQESIKIKEIKFDHRILHAKIASRNLVSNKIIEDKTMIVKLEQPPIKSKFKVKFGNIIKNVEVKKEINTSKSKKTTKATKATENFEIPKMNKSLNKNLFNTTKKTEQNKTKNNKRTLIKILANEKSEGIKIYSNFLNFSKNLPLGKKL